LQSSYHSYCLPSLSSSSHLSPRCRRSLESPLPLVPPVPVAPPVLLVLPVLPVLPAGLVLLTLSVLLVLLVGQLAPPLVRRPIMPT